MSDITEQTIVEHVSELIYDEPLLTYCEKKVKEYYKPTQPEDPIFYELLHLEVTRIVTKSLDRLIGTRYGV